MIGYENSRGSGPKGDILVSGALTSVLDADQLDRYRKIRQYWDFYEGYHFNQAPMEDSPELTVNYCRAFVNKFTAFEMGKEFTFTIHPDMKGLPVATKKFFDGQGDSVVPLLDRDSDEETTQGQQEGLDLFHFLEYVWKDNNRAAFCNEMCQSKSVTGEAWVQVGYDALDGEGEDVFGEYPGGRVVVNVLPTDYVWPDFDPHTGELASVEIMYPYQEDANLDSIWTSKDMREKVFRQKWTPTKVYTKMGDEELDERDNEYGFIPIVQIKNLSTVGVEFGISDLEDIIPMNMELNLKHSNVSEILDYHAAPVTVVYGAKVSNLEKGANKMWGGLAKDAKVENLELRSNLGSSLTYIDTVKREMCEVGGIPETVLGGSQAISNTSAVALQVMNLPLIEKTRMKKMNTLSGITLINKYIIFIALKEGLIKKPEGVSSRSLYATEPDIPDTMPKDELMQLQVLQAEMRMGINNRHGALSRLNREDIETTLQEVDEDVQRRPEFYGISPGDNVQDMLLRRDDEDSKVAEETVAATQIASQAATLAQAATMAGATPQVNSGVMNGDTAVEQVRKEITGSNGMTNDL